MKKRKRDLDNPFSSQSSYNARGGGDEPLPVQRIYPNTATVVLDSKQSATYTGLQNVYLQNGGWTYPGTGSFFAGPPADARLLPNSSSVLSSGTDVSGGGGTSLSGPGHFSATINPLSGCSRTTYFGSYTSGPAWDTHRGNSILSLRIFIEADDIGPSGDGDNYCKDIYIKIPDGIVFRDDIRAARAEVANLMNYLLNNKTYRSDYPRASDGWTEPDTGGLLDPGLDLFTCWVDDGSQRIKIRMNKENLIDGYKLGGSSFLIFDDPYGLTTRGGQWSGFGYENPNFTYNASAHFPDPTGSALLQEESRRQYKSYPGRGNFLFRETIPLASYTDVNTGAMLKVDYTALKLATYAKLGISPARVFSGLLDDFGIEYSAVRAAALKDIRYQIISSSELCYDRKIIPLVSQGPPTTIGPNTLGINFITYENHDGEKQYNTRAWRVNENQSETYHPSVYLAANASTMRITMDITTDWGELLLASIEGQCPGRRDMAAGETNPCLPGGAPDPPLVALAKLAYPTGATAPTPGLADTAGGNFPYWSYYKDPSAKTGSSIDTASATRTTNRDLRFYFDNLVRVASNDSVIHFLLNDMYEVRSNE